MAAVSPAPAAAALHVACLCADWCRVCEGFEAVFRGVTAGLQPLYPGLVLHWIDIEDEAELLGDLDIETFPTVLVADDAGLRFAGPVTPQAAILERVLRAALAAPAHHARTPLPQAHAFEALAARLRTL